LVKKSTDDPAQYGDKAWKNDPIESARRIWEWWRAKKDDDVRIRHLVVAARLVVLVQVSSAPVERVFSQVKNMWSFSSWSEPVRRLLLEGVVLHLIHIIVCVHWSILLPCWSYNVVTCHNSWKQHHKSTRMCNFGTKMCHKIV
jgi:hypothetical protein